MATYRAPASGGWQQDYYQDGSWHHFSSSRYFQITITDVDGSPATNESRVKWKIEAKEDSKWYDAYCKLTINGNVVYEKTSGWSSGSFPSAQGSAEGYSPYIRHNDDGTKSIAIEFSAYVFAYTKQNYSWTFAMNQIARASTATCPGGALGASMTISSNRPSGTSFTHTINIKSGNTTLDTFTNVGASQSWTPAIATYAPYITGSAPGVFTIETTTYNSGTQIGDVKTSTVSLTVPNAVKPSVSSITLAEGNSVVAQKNWGVYIQKLSQLQVTIAGTPAYGSAITNYNGTVEGVSYSGSPFKSNVLQNSGTFNVSATVKDARGNTSNAATQPYTVVPYFNPTISTFSVIRCNSSGVVDEEEGEYFRYSLVASIAPVSNHNTKVIRIKWRKTTESGFPSANVITLTPSGTNYTINANNVFAGSGPTYKIVNTSTYIFVAECIDAFKTTSQELTIGTGFDLMNFNTSGRAMAIGKTSEATGNNKLLEVALPTIFETSIDMDAQGSVGNTLKKVIVDAIYPVGSVYINANSSNYNPNNLFPGTTWTQIQSKFLLAAGSGYNIGATGGSAELQAHTHGVAAQTGTAASNGAHTHELGADKDTTYNSGGGCWSMHNNSPSGSGYKFYTGSAGAHTHDVTIPAHTTDSAGTGNQGNMPPYVVVYVWRRTA